MSWHDDIESPPDFTPAELAAMQADTIGPAIHCECGTGPTARAGHDPIYRDGAWHHYDGTHCHGNYEYTS